MWCPLQRPAWWRPGETIDRPLTHEEIAYVSTPSAATALVEDEPSGSASKRRKDPIVRDWSLDMLDQVEDTTTMGHAAVPRDIRRGQQEHSALLEAEHTTSNTAWQEDFAVTRRHDTAERARHAGYIRPVPECGNDPRLGARMARRKGTRRASREWVRQLLHGMRLSNKKPAKCVKELHIPALQEANTHRLFIKWTSTLSGQTAS